MSMKDFAHHIIAVANDNELSITNLQLQKVMYFTLQKALKHGLLNQEQLQDLYDSPFLVWRYGPVEKDIYERYSVFGSDSIIEENECKTELNPLNRIIIDELEKDPFDLVNKSHREKFWQEHENEIHGWRSDVKYTLADIKVGAR